MHTDFFFCNVLLPTFLISFFLFSPKGSKGEHGADGEAGQKGDQVRTYFVNNLKGHHCFSWMNFILPFLTSPLGSPSFEVGIFFEPHFRGFHLDSCGSLSHSSSPVI